MKKTTFCFIVFFFVAFSVFPKDYRISNGSIKKDETELIVVNNSPEKITSIKFEDVTNRSIDTLKVNISKGSELRIYVKKNSSFRLSFIDENGAVHVSNRNGPITFSEDRVTVNVKGLATESSLVSDILPFVVMIVILGLIVFAAFMLIRFVYRLFRKIYNAKRKDNFQQETKQSNTNKTKKEEPINKRTKQKTTGFADGIKSFFKNKENWGILFMLLALLCFFSFANKEIPGSKGLFSRSPKHLSLELSMESGIMALIFEFILYARGILLFSSGKENVKKTLASWLKVVINFAVFTSFFSILFFPTGSTKDGFAQVFDILKNLGIVTGLVAGVILFGGTNTASIASLFFVVILGISSWNNVEMVSDAAGILGWVFLALSLEDFIFKKILI